MSSYLEVKAEILRRITRRTFAPGALLPGEIEQKNIISQFLYPIKKQ